MMVLLLPLALTAGNSREYILANEFNQDLKAFIIDPWLQRVDDA